MVDLGGVAAEGGDFGDAVALGNEPVAALNGLGARIPGKREHNDRREYSFHSKLKLSFPHERCKCSAGNEVLDGHFRDIIGEVQFQKVPSCPFLCRR